MYSAQQPEAARPRRRGPIRCLALHRMAPGERISMDWNDSGQPTGPKAATFSNYIGIVARDGNNIPLDLASWWHISAELKRHAFQIIQEKYDLTEENFYIVCKIMNKRWKDYKNELKAKYFNPLNPHVVVPPSVIDSQWNVLIDYWLSEAGQNTTEINKRSRQQQVLVHTTGTRTFARVRNSLTTEAGPPSRAELFIKTHTRKDGTPVNDVAAEKIATRREFRSSAPEGSTDSTCRDDVFSQVMGPERSERVRSCGLGPTPTRLWGSSSNAGESSSRAQMQQRISYLESMVATLQEEMRAVQERVDPTDATQGQSSDAGVARDLAEDED